MRSIFAKFTNRASSILFGGPRYAITWGQAVLIFLSGGICVLIGDRVEGRLPSMPAQVVVSVLLAALALEMLAWAIARLPSAGSREGESRADG